MKKNTNTSEKSKILMRTYVTSLLSLMLCVTLLLGTTYAWFTSEVTTVGNEIYVGTLKVDMVKTVDGKDVSLVNQGGLFGSGSVKWEPGATQIETVKVVNQGDLAFDYALYLSTVGSDQPENLLTIGKYIDVYITTHDADADNAQELKENWIRVGTLADTVTNGVMLSNGSWKNGQENLLDTVKIALHMPADVSDTSIMGKKITNLGVRLMATQKVAETDDFGSGYDESAPVDAMVATYSEFAAAVNAGQSMRLSANITVPENTTLTVASGKQVVIDMNGYDITAATSGTDANRELFLVKGNLIIKGEKTAVTTVAEGETADPYKSVITYSHKAEDNMHWNRMTTIFDITAGGSVQLLDVKAVNAGGSDMNFAAHLNNWGTASLYMDGSWVEAPYCAIRVNNSGYDMNNVVATDSTITSDNRALWVQNYIGDLDSSKHSDEAIDARLNISILNGNSISGNICYGFNKSVYHVTDGAGFNRAMEKEADEIVLEGNVNVGNNTYLIKAGKNFTLDLNGHDLTAAQNPTAESGTAVAVFTVANGATMIVEGEGNVKLTTNATNNNNISMAIFRNEGELNLNGGNYEVAGNTVKVDGAMVIATIVDTCLYKGDAITTINGGSYKVTGNAGNLFRNYPTHNENCSATLIINDGVFNANPNKTNTCIWNQQNKADYVSKMEFNGGTYEAGVVYEDYFGQTDIKVTDAAKNGGLTAYSGNN